jgi:4-hydroxybenzoate polyprenyltransferase
MNARELKQRLTLYEKLMRLDKPIGTLLLLWPTFWALWLATEGQPHILLVWIFALGTLLMRSAGCVINDYADRDFDPHVKRTRERPLAAGTVSVREALVLFAVLCLCAFLVPADPARGLVADAGRALPRRQLSLHQALLRPAAGLPRRRLRLRHPMAFAAATGEVGALGWTLLVANIFWALAYDTEYAMVDRDDDLKIGIRTAAITFGRFDVIAVMSLLRHHPGHPRLDRLGPALRLGYFGGLALAALIAGYHYTLIRDRDRDGCFRAFRHNNWFGAAVFAGIVAELNLRPWLGW